MNQEAVISRAFTRLSVFVCAVFLGTHAHGQGGPLTLTELPAPGEGLFTALVNDSYSAVGSGGIDDWSFEAEVGDRISVRVESTVGGARPKIRLLNASGTTLVSVDGSVDGFAEFTSYVVATPGTLRVRTFTDNAVSAYRLRVDLSRFGPSLDAEPNNAFHQASLPLFSLSGPSEATSRIHGLLPRHDTGDFFQLGELNAGADIDLSVTRPAASTLPADAVGLALYRERRSSSSLDFLNAAPVVIPHSPVFDALETSQTMTLEAWIYVRNFNSGWFPIFEKYEASGDSGWGFGVENNSNGLQLWTSVGVRRVSNVRVPLNRWTHVAVVYDPSNAVALNRVRFFMDGRLVSTSTSPGALVDTAGEAAYLGFSPAGGDEFSGGRVADVRVWNVARSDAQILAGRDVSYSAPQAGLVANWRLNEGALEVANDSSGSDLHGVLGGVGFSSTPAWAAGRLEAVTVPALGTKYTPASYTATAGESGSYAYTDQGGTQLTDGVLGGPTFYTDLGNGNAFEWLGWASAQPTFNFTFAAPQPVRMVRIGFSRHQSSGVYLPDAVTINGVVHPISDEALLDESRGFLSFPMPAGADVSAITIQLTDSSTGQWIFVDEVEFYGAASSAATLSYSADEAGAYYAEVSAAFGGAIESNYLLGATLSDTAPLGVTRVSLPNEGSSFEGYLQSITVLFNGQLDPVSAVNLSNYQLRGPGANSIYGDADDVIYTFGPALYDGVRSVTLPILNAPVQFGPARFTVSSSILNRFGASMSGAFVRNFSVAGLPTPSGRPMILETSDNNAPANATRLGAPGPQAQSFSVAPTFVDIRSGGSTSNWQPTGVVVARTRGPGAPLDIIVSNYNSNSVSVLLGNGNGTFAAPVSYPVQSNPWDIRAVDLDGDGDVEIITGNYSSSSLSILRGNGDGTFAAATNLPALTNLYWFEVGDLTGDGRPDIVHTSYGSNQLRVHINAGDGTFPTQATYPVAGGAYGLDLGDVDGDGDRDVVVAAYTDRRFLTLFNNGSGVLTNGPSFIWQTDASDAVDGLKLADMDGDGVLDLVAMSNTRAINTVFRGNGDGSFSGGVNFSTSHNSDNYKMVVRDLDGDGRPEIIVGTGQRIAVVDNQSSPGTLAFGSPNWRDTSSWAMGQDFGDLNGDGFLDFVVAERDLSRVRIMLGEPQILVASDVGGGSNPGFRSVSGRGVISSASDEDWWVFHMEAGERLILNTAGLFDFGAQSLRYRIWQSALSSSNYILDSTSGGDASAQWAFVAPASGNYYLQVLQSQENRSEYRFQLSIAPATFTVEYEGNGTTGTANPLAWIRSAQLQTSAAFGVLSAGDSSDFLQLGNLDAGTSINLSLVRPPSSTLSWQLEVWNGTSGTAVAQGALNQPTLNFVVPVGGANFYYARVVRAVGYPNFAASLFSGWQMTISLADSLAPTITGTSLPPEGGVLGETSPLNRAFVDSFTISFSEDMDADSVNALTSYSMVWAGPDNVLGNGDDVEIPLERTVVYSSGLSMGLRPVDTPILPGVYRFEARTSLRDRSFNPLASVFTRTWSIAAPPSGFIFEGLTPNNSGALAIPLAPPTNPWGLAWQQTQPTLDVRVASTANWQPEGLATARLRGPGQPLDLISVNAANASVSVLLGNGDGTFAAPVRYAVQGNPWNVRVADMNGDGSLDLVTANRNTASVSVLLNNGNGTFAAATHTSVSSGPTWFTLADIDGNGSPDFITTNYSASLVAIRPNNGDGSFGPQITFTAAGGGNGVEAADLDSDGDVDIAVACYDANLLRVFLNNGSGSFTEGTPFAWTPAGGDRIESVWLADMDGDGNTDAVLQANTNATNLVVRGNGDGTFGPTTGSFSTSHNSDNYKFLLQDFSGDGLPDISVGNGQRFMVIENLGGFRFSSPNFIDASSWVMGVAAGDFNSDGLVDHAFLQRDVNTIRLLLGQGEQVLPADVTPGSSAAGFRSVALRGNISNDSDQDYYSFSARAGERLLISTVAGSPSNTASLRFRLWTAGFSTSNYMLDTTASGQGTDQWVFTVPFSGTYYLQVVQSQAYRGEYRVHIMTAPATWQTESEDNNSRGNADLLTFARSTGVQTAQATGVLLFNDSGDYFQLGNLAEGTLVNLGIQRPASSGLQWIAEIWNAAGGSAVATSAINATTLSYTIPAGQAGFYYARIRIGSAFTTQSESLFSAYQLSISLADSAPPSITGTSLPVQGAVLTDNWVDVFSLSFSEDMEPGSVNAPASYEYRWAGADGIFDNGDDVVEPILLTSTYASGLSQSYRANNILIQPGNYRFRAYTTLLDRYLNPITSVFERQWSLALPSTPFTSEGLSPNNTPATATLLGTLGTGFGWSFQQGPTAIDVRPESASTADYRPADVAAVRLRGPAAPVDLVFLNENNASITVRLGDGSGGYAPAVRYAVQNSPWMVEVADLNGDSFLDLVTTNRNSNSLSVLIGVGDGTFMTAANSPLPASCTWFRIADLNGDNRPDFVGSTYTTGALHVRLNNGDGTFGVVASTPGNGGTNGLDVGDVDGDGDLDVVAALWDARGYRVYLNDGSGGMSAGANNLLTTPSNDPIELARMTDFDGDGIVDLLLTHSARNEIWILRGVGDGTFVHATTASAYDNNDNYKVVFADFNGDGRPDIVIGNYQYLSVIENRSTPGNFRFAGPEWRRFSSFILGQAVADVNADGFLDLVAVARDSQVAHQLLGQADRLLPATVGTGIAAGSRSILFRGNLANSSDVDYYSFFARAGERVILTVSNPFVTGAGSLRFRLWRSNISTENYLLDTTASAAGNDQWSFNIPHSGYYFVQVVESQVYRGEYRGGIHIFPESFAIETEDNNARGNADAITFTRSVGTSRGRFAGVVPTTDSGDYFQLGNLAAGTEIVLNLAYPDGTSFTPILEIHDGSTVLLTGAPGQTSLNLVAPAGAFYYGRIRQSVAYSPQWLGLSSSYQITADLNDTQAPTVLSTTLPNEGSVATGLIDRLTLTLSEDVEAPSANNLGSYDLRASGPDDIFDTIDDVVVAFVGSPGYTSGTSLSLRFAAGALPEGRYRFTARSTITDLYLNPLTQFVRTFQVQGLVGYTLDREPNNSIATATPLGVSSTQAGQFQLGGRGFLLDTGDSDFFSFSAEAGDRILLFSSYGTASGQSVRYTLFTPAGATVDEWATSTTGVLEGIGYTAVTTGVHSIRVRFNNDYRGEYRFRLLLLRGITAEAEPNDTIATATTLAMSASGDGVGGTAGGLIFSVGGLDYYRLGTVNAGTTIFVSTRLPANSKLLPVVGVYTAAGALVPEATGGRAGDGVAQVPITLTGTYFALVRASGTSHGIDSDYLLDALILPTGGATFPNLVATWLTLPPSSGLLSGANTNLSFRVDNVGSTATGFAAWNDRVVLSTDLVYGNADDIEVAVIPRNSALANGASYTVNQPVRIPDGISGSFNLIVRTDSGNTVNEFILEGDNETVGDTPLQITLANYPDLIPENFAISSPTEAGVYTITWTLANRGTGVATAPFNERVFVRNNTTNAILLNSSVTQSTDLAAGATRARSAQVTTLLPGVYTVEVLVDSGSSLYEFNASGNLAAEQNNAATGGFTIFRTFTISVAADPVGAGTVSGGGTFPEGTTRTVIATPTPPNTFIGWFESGFLRSSSANYSFPLTGDRNLTARFSLPQFLVATQVNPAGAGSITGGGVYSLGTLVNLTVSSAPGYIFQNWSEGATNLGSSTTLPVTVSGARTLVANFTEANPLHTVTTATSPAGVATVTGAGTYANNIPVVFTAPSPVVVGDTEYLFERFTLNGSQVSTAPTFTRSFTTLDPASVVVTAVYSSRSLKPTVINAAGSVVNPVGPNRDFRLSIRFDRSMDINVPPALVFTPSQPGTPVIPATGTWTTTSISNDTFQTSLFQFSSGNNGTWQLGVSTARDTQGRVMDPASVATIVVDTVAPAHPVPAVSGYTNTSASIQWTAYSAPADLASFRIYRQLTPFSSTTGLTTVGTAGASLRNFTLTGLEPDTVYHVAVAAVDTAGNSNPAVTTIPVQIVSSIPPPVPTTLTSPNLTTARLNWSGYSTSALLGFEGFRIYRSETPFSSVTGLTPIATVAANLRTFDDTGLDRTRTYYYAVVGANRLGGINPAVTTVFWVDPLSLPINANLTIGGAGESDIPVFNDLNVLNGATLTIRAGTTLRFAADAGVTVTSGRLVTQGTALAPVVLTAATDDGNAGNGQPVPGQWDGVALSDGSRTSSLAHTWVNYGKGLRLTAGTATLDTFAAVWNTGAGLLVTGTGSSITTSKAYLAFNQTGASVGANGSLTLSGSVLKNNSSFNASNLGGTLNAGGNWWGTAQQSGILPLLSGLVDITGFLAAEPVLTSGIAADGATTVGSRNVSVRVAGLNAQSYRISEDSNFAGALFLDLPDAALYRTFPVAVPFQLSEGAGLKTVYLQLRSLSGSLGPVVSLNLTYLTDGPVIQSFSLTEGMTLRRPVTVTGSATAALGLAQIRLMVDDVQIASSASSPFTFLWDIRSLTPRSYRARLEAVDTAGNLATRSVNVIVTPEPPPAPTITLPANGASFVASTTTVSGTAEANASLRLLRNGLQVTTGTANGSGAFSFTSVPLAEGGNTLVVVAFDAIGSTNSNTVAVVSDTAAPAAPTLLPAEYRPGEGVFLDWELPTSGEVPVSYRVFWHTAPFTTIAQATGQTPGLTLRTDATITGLGTATYHFAVVGYDSAGNPSPLSNRVSLAVDAVRPTLTYNFSNASGANPNPVGPGDLTLTLVASEPLREAPITLLRLANGTILSLRMTDIGGLSYRGTFPVAYASAVSGAVSIAASGALDVAGNTYTGAISGPPLVFDLTRPTGALSFSLPQPIQTTDPVTVGVNLTLSELPAPGTTPTLSFTAPAGGDPVALSLTGSGLVWSAQLALTPAMGSGIGSFTLGVTDSVGNTGFGFTSGSTLELYTGATPAAPAAPSALSVVSRPAGVVRLTWPAAENAFSYSIYREAGSGAGVPATQIASGVTALTFDDTPPSDGAYRYVVRGFRLGSEGGPSPVRTAVSDRAAPEAPQTTTATLLASGVRVAWTAPASGETPAGYRIYRNGVSLGTAAAAGQITDSPPKGIITYRVASFDAVGNENLGPSATLELIVGAVNNLLATADFEGSVQLTWSSGDPATAGYHVYRNGSRQTASPITTPSYVDPLPRDGSAAVVYSVTAVNASGVESAARTVDVQPLTLGVELNPTDAGAAASVTRYFDRYRITITAPTGGGGLRLSSAQVNRTVLGETPAVASFSVPSLLPDGASHVVDVAVPAPVTATAVQTFQVLLSQASDLGGSSVTYRFTAEAAGAVDPAFQMTLVAAGQQPLAGGLANFSLQVFNRGFMPADLVLSRGNNTEPGELSLQIFVDDILVAEFPTTVTVPGMIFSSGTGFLRLAAGASATLPINGIAIPSALAGEENVTFVARFRRIYNNVGSTQERIAGPLLGEMDSSLRNTPYYGTAESAQTALANNVPVVISGQALDRVTGLPVPNVPLRIGILVQGARLFDTVVTDAAGAYTFSYTPPYGVAGAIQLWAAHPEVVDLLNQVRLDYYRIFLKPSRADIIMSKNDFLNFDIGLLNLGDNTLGGATVNFRAYRIVSGAEVPVPEITGELRQPVANPVGPKSEVPVRLRLNATADAPDNAIVEFTVVTPEGAGSTFIGNVQLRPAVPVLSVTSPSEGYALTSIDRGGIRSVDVTVTNRGLRDLEGVRIVPPASLPWIQLNLAPGASGEINLPNIPIGGSRTITVVFAPPAGTPVGFYDDFFLIRGTNAVGDFRVNLFARVTSNQTGSAEFSVKNILGEPVANASLSLRDATLGTERGPVLSDANGIVVFDDLMEGDWQWRISAPGHGSQSGVITVVAGEVALTEIEMTLALVTVKFSVVPVPFTDYYEIKLEQTFFTFTPVPNLVMTPAHQTLAVEPGFVGTVLYKLKNTGLRSAFGVQINGQSFPTMRLTPLINYLPELAAQEEVEIPTVFEYFGPQEEAGAALPALAANTSGVDLKASIGGGKGGDSTTEGVFVRAASDFLPPGPAQDIAKCYEEMKYGTITLTAAAFVESTSNKTYTVGVNATIDVDQLISILCDGDCPDDLFGGGVIGAVGNYACDKLLGKAVEAGRKANKAYDIICKATNIIKAIVCALAQLPTSNGSFGTPGGGGPGGGGSGPGCWCGPGGPGIVYSGCFAPGTSITLADGTTQRVENLTVGQHLRDASGRSNRIANLVRRTSDHLRQIQLVSSDGSQRELRLTHDHRLWVEGAGWVFSHEISAGALLRGQDGMPVRVVSNQRVPGEHTVVLVHMDDDGVLFAEGVLAEDQCAGAQRIESSLSNGFIR